MKRADPGQELALRDAELRARRQEITDLHAELEATNRGLIALHAELENARQAEARLAAIVQSSDDAMFSTAADGTIQTWNPGARRLYGYDAAEIVGRPAATLVPDEARERFEEALETIRSGDRARTYDTRQCRRDGSVVDVSVTLSVMRDGDGAATGFSAVVRDITNRLRMQVELAAARAAQEVIADRDRIARDLHDMVIQRIFAAGLSLQSMTGLIEHPQARERLRTVTEELDLTIRELRTAIFDLHHPPQETAGLRAQLLRLTSGAAGALGFTPATAFEGPIDTAVPGHVAVHLLTVVREALSNIARHAHATGAEVTISADADLTVRIADNGCGFEHPTRSSGLRNLRDRATQLGGVFEVTSRPGMGTRLDWRVPLPRQ
jgi:two-component system, NarL family, sensor histidine kinase DevS